MNPKSTVDALNRFLYAGLGNNLFLHVNTHTLRTHGEETVVLSPAAEIGMVALEGLTLKEYVELVASERYSAILYDYSLISIECVFSEGRIARHRYMYIPCPISQELLSQRPEDMEVADYLEQIDSDNLKRHFLSHGHVRFDYTNDPVNSDIFHPLSHLTFISSDCRIALKAPISISEFLTFLFDNFYSHYAKSWIDYQPHLKSICEDSIRDHETTRMHLFWIEEF